ncbi:MAG: hypothetical protein H0V12_01565 [Chloroflexi bacterium]|nr:hypothetical protein [Chloroflexota bacterium]
MIRQLRRLTRQVPAAGPGALALAVYAEPEGERLARRPAAESGFEGVACVDDAARAAALYCTIWERHRFPWARAAAEGMLAFVSYMQDPDGRFVNFILDWDGHQNRTSPTSRAGDLPWAARAAHALANGCRTLGEPRWRERLEAVLPWLDRPTDHLNVRAVCVLAALEALEAGVDGRERIARWADEIAAGRRGDALLDSTRTDEIHLWGHLQEAALARAGVALGRSDLVLVARASAEALLLEPARRGFHEARAAIPFDVSSTVLGLSAVGEATGEARYTEAAELARAWFDGRNSARQPVYDRRRGLVCDGVDDGRVSENSGAESNIEGALALFGSLPWAAYA